jgi:hypothetical protein
MTTTTTATASAIMAIVRVFTERLPRVAAAVATGPY